MTLTPKSPFSPKGSWSAIDLQWHGDDRGGLVVVESRKDVPFEIRRVYYLIGTRPDTNRGFHAHRELDQVLVAISGACTVTVNDGYKSETVRLDNSVKGLRITNLIWREMSEFTPDCVLLVFASDFYKENDYIRDHEIFLKAVHEE